MTDVVPVAVELRERLQAILGDAYVIERELAPGGMSRLFLAREASLDRAVVIKLLPPETASEVSAARFQRRSVDGKPHCSYPESESSASAAAGSPSASTSPPTACGACAREATSS